jgi:hypothetical protein
MDRLPQTGFARLPMIIGDRRKGIPAIIPVSRSYLVGRRGLRALPETGQTWPPGDAAPAGGATHIR